MGDVQKLDDRIITQQMLDAGVSEMKEFLKEFFFYLGSEQDHIERFVTKIYHSMAAAKK